MMKFWLKRVVGLAFWVAGCWLWQIDMSELTWCQWAGGVLSFAMVVNLWGGQVNE